MTDREINAAPALLSRILAETQALGVAERGERGMVHGRRTSTPASRRSPVNLDVLVLTDRRTGVLAKLLKWSQRVRVERGEPPLSRPVPHGWWVVEPPSIEREAQVLFKHWAWVVEQPWYPELQVELTGLLELLTNGGRPVPARPCPVCGGMIRLDRVAEEIVDHRACLGEEPPVG